MRNSLKESIRRAEMLMASEPFGSMEYAAAFNLLGHARQMKAHLDSLCPILEIEL